MNRLTHTYHLQKNFSLNQIQNYMNAMAQHRGFTNQTARDTLLVMIEECGELAKAIRKYSGIGIDHTRSQEYGNLAHEMADVLICLLMLANKCNVNLYQALEQKEQINQQRVWQVAQKKEI